MSVRSHSVTASVDPAVVWDHFTNAEHWALDNPYVAKAQLNGPVAKGAGGIVSPVGGRRQGFRVVDVEQNRRFTIRFALLLAYLTVEFTLTRPDHAANEPDADGDAEDAAADSDTWVLTQSLSFRGPGARLWNRLRGRAIADSFPVALKAIADAAAV